MSQHAEAIGYLSDLVERILSEAISQSELEDLTQKQLLCMRVIVRLKDPTISELARELMITKSTATVLVDKLVAKRYLKRVSSDHDKRVTHLHTDENGRKIELLREIAHQRLAERIHSGLDDNEKQMLSVLLRKIVRL